MSRLPVADDFEALAAATVHERGPVPIRPSAGKTRVLRTESGRRVTLGRVLEAVALKAECEIAVQEGRPENVLCRTCKHLIKVHPGGGVIPDQCKRCKGALCSSCGEPSAQGKPVKFCQKCVSAKRMAKITCVGCGGRKYGRRSDKCNACQVAERAAAKLAIPIPRCSDCRCQLARESKSPRCMSCAGKVREANLTDEQRRAKSARATAQRARERMAATS